MNRFTFNKLAMIAGCPAIGVICAIVWPVQPQSMILSVSWCALWCALLIALEPIPPRER